MARLKVKRARLPYKILEQQVSQANTTFKLLLDNMFGVIEDVIRHGAADADFHHVVGSQLQRSAAEGFLKAERTYQRRLKHGAPVTPTQLKLHEAQRVLGAINLFEPEQLNQSMAFASETTEPERKTTLIDPTNVIGTTAPLDPVLLMTLMTAPTDYQPKVIRSLYAEEYTYIGGGEMAVAALLTSTPLIEALVYYPNSTVPHEVGEGRLLQELVVQYQTSGLPQGYDLASYWEPFAELARALDYDTYNRLRTGTINPEITDLLREKITLRGRLKEADPVVAKQIDTRLEYLETRIKDAQAREENLKTLWAMARTASNAYAELDGITKDQDPDIWNEAQLPAAEQPFPSLFPSQIELEVQLDENWFAARIDRLTPEGVVLYLEDGSRRLVQNPALLRRATIEPEEPMPGITIPRFNVAIPEGSASYKIEEQLVPITEELNTHPLVVNRDTWVRNLKAMAETVERQTAECRAEAGWDEFRPNAGADCQKVFIDKLGLPVQRVTKGKGTPSLDKETLAVWQNMGNKLAGLVIECRESMSKLSQLTAWQQYAEAGEVQANWDSLGQPHGRYTCDNPNLQNRIREIRETIEADHAHQLVSFDIGQAEYVTWASLSKDPVLEAAFLGEKDFHQAMFDEIKAANPTLEHHEENDRQAGKTFNFAQLYLMQAFTLAKRLGLTVEQAKEILAAYAARAPMSIEYRDAYCKTAIEFGFVSTFYGRKRLMPELKTAKGPKLHELLKTCWHHHNAGTAAEILKIKQIKVWKELRRQLPNVADGRLVLQMHDEIVFSVRDDFAEKFAKIGEEIFSAQLKDFLPFKTTTKIGPNWLSVSK